MSNMRVLFEDATSYLSRADWQPVVHGPLAEIWQASSPASERIMVPKIESAPDYPQMLRNLTTELARIERRSPDEIHEDMARQFFDITKLRASADSSLDHTIPLHAGIELFESAKRLVVASAASTLMRQGNFGRNIPKRALNHAKHVRLGHTMEGSYVVPVISEVRVPDVYADNEGPGVLPELDLKVEAARFDRRVTTTMARALEVLGEISVNRDRTPSSAEVHDAVSEGVSRELCDAVARVLSTGQVDSYDVNFQWAPAIVPPRLLTSQVDFPKESVRIVEDIADTLKSAERVQEQVIFGIITNCAAPPHEGFGRVTVQAAIDGKVRTVKFDLNWQAFGQASKFMTERRPVFVRGVLHMPTGRQATMEVSAFGPDPSTMTLDDALEGDNTLGGPDVIPPQRGEGA
ncbi:hypothetical protein [Streptomyces sp. WAC 06738]|uniref:hypothetical protein n=1 Tax=Streptomyces sp. WAC 06738 TaxID=2203210 RepID=UPI000F78B03F|nr:hypothetical protein [Streptomyces sp. WAC 06738]